MAKPDETGSGYFRDPNPTYIKELVEVGRGTPMGEYMRRYWHPIAVASEIKDLPVRRRILGEDLVLFRDGKGRLGAVYEFCAHRGASLFFGRVDEAGIRCCYHGWMFDVEGHCLNQPLEKGGGKCTAIRQPWYPVQELYGLAFLYMGPPDQRPLLPRYKGMEHLADDEYYAHAFDSLPGSVDEALPTSWLIDMDNMHDMSHVFWMHHLHSGPQFGPATAHVTMENAAALHDAIEYIETEHGMYSLSDQPMPDGSVASSRLESLMPNVRIICPPVQYGEGYHMNWCVPADDGSHYAIGLARVKKGGINMTVNPMSFWDRSDPEVVQRTPSDNEAQNTQGPLPRHSEEHLVLADRGVGRMRRQYMRQLKAMENGERLMNIRFDGEDPFIPTMGGAWEKTPAPEGAAREAAALFEEAHGGVLANVGGNWLLTMNTPMGAQEVVFAITQSGSSLFGTMREAEGGGDAVELRLGHVRGQHATWTADIVKPMAMTMVFDMIVEGDAMTGTFKPGPFPPGEASGVRVREPALS